jgi:hypothetical protein
MAVRGLMFGFGLELGNDGTASFSLPRLVMRGNLGPGLSNRFSICSGFTT